MTEAQAFKAARKLHGKLGRIWTFKDPSTNERKIGLTPARAGGRGYCIGRGATWAAAVEDSKTRAALLPLVGCK